MNEIHIGTSGWSYKGWKGTFYPEKLKTTDYLSFYAQHYKVTEINSSFYHLPLASTVHKWVDQVPDDFLFCPKISRYLSHMKKLHDPEEPLERFFDIFKPMKDKMGPVLIQLPASVAFDAKTDEIFYATLMNKYPEYEFAMEVRHESWYSNESLDLMKRYNIAFVIAQSEKFPYKEFITAKNIYVRFHGPKALYASSYSDQVLKEYAEKFLIWQKEGHTVWAFFNNDINGHALSNTSTLLNFIQSS